MFKVLLSFLIVQLSYYSLAANLQGNYNQSIENVLRNFETQEKQNDKKGMINSLVELGKINREQGYYFRANESFDRAYNLALQIGDFSLQGFALVEKGRTQREQEEPAKALITLSKARKIIYDNKTVWLYGYVIDEIGKVYMSEKRYDMALEQFMKSVQIAEENNSQSSLGYTYLNISKIYRINKDFVKAKEFCDKSLATRKAINDEKGIVKSLNELSEIYLNEKNNKKALESGYEALRIAEKIKSQALLLDCYKELSNIHSRNSNYKEALNYHQLFSGLKDSLSGGENNRKVEEMQSRYEEEKKDKEIGELKKEQKLRESEAKEQRIILILISFMLLVFVALAYNMFKQFKERKRAFALLENTNLELEKLSIVARETDNAVVIMDSSGNFEWANEAFSKLSGYTLPEFVQVIGKSLMEASTTEEIREKFKMSLTKKITVEYEFFANRKNGEPFWAHATLTPILNEAGELKKMVIIETDITEKKNAQLKLQQKNQEISESISYAKRIQDSIIPSAEFIAEVFPDSFIFYRPKDIVSGDFPWYYKKGNDVYIAVVDCTGHGVPGAMISFVGYFLLNEINSHDAVLPPSVILDMLHKKLVSTLKQDLPNSINARDGLDIALCKINLAAKKVEFAGANRPLIKYTAEADGLEEITGDKLAIGGKSVALFVKKQRNNGVYLNEEEFKFTNHSFKYETGDAVFLNSDGMQDQFGGAERKKYGKKRMKKIIADNSSRSMAEIGRLFTVDFDTWIGSGDQLDDILLIGIRF